MIRKIGLILILSFAFLQTKANDSLALAQHINKMITTLKADDLKAWEQFWQIDQVLESGKLSTDKGFEFVAKYSLQQFLYQSFVYAYYPFGTSSAKGVNNSALDWSGVLLKNVCYHAATDSLGKKYSGTMYLQQTKHGPIFSFRFNCYLRNNDEMTGIYLSHYEGRDTLPMACPEKIEPIKPKPAKIASKLTSAEAIKRYLDISTTFKGTYDTQPATFYCYKIFPEDTVFKIARIQTSAGDWDVMHSLQNRSRNGLQIVYFFDRSEKLIIVQKNGQINGTVFDEDYNIKGKLSVRLSD